MKPLDFVLINEAGGAATSTGAVMTPSVLTAIAAACQVQLNRDVSAHWGGAYRVRAASSGADIMPGEIVFALLATLPGSPNAIAYHDVDGVGVPVIYDGVTLSDTLTGAGNSVSVAISHELCETAGDAGCNVWADANGTEYARELCDAVEAQSYTLSLSNPVAGQNYDVDGVALSNFVIPAFFVPNHVGPFDFMSTVGPNPNAPSAPFVTAPGGYQITRDSGQHEGQVTAKHNASVPISFTVSATIPFGMRRSWRFDSRRAKRGVTA